MYEHQPSNLVIFWGETEYISGKMEHKGEHFSGEMKA